MKKIILILTIFPLWGLAGLNAQKELWGVSTYGNTNGSIVKMDITGENQTAMHLFNFTHGTSPQCKLLLASNGKIYGTTTNGGIINPSDMTESAGVLFEYDLILNKFKVLHFFDFDANGSYSQKGVIEPIAGQLIGATQGKIFKYDIASSTITFSNPMQYSIGINSALIMASDGFIYGTACYQSATCQDPNQTGPVLNNIIRYNIATNQLSLAYSIYCSNGFFYGFITNTELVEGSPGKLYGATRIGGTNYVSPSPFTYGGTLFEFDINTDVFTKKLDFSYATNGQIPNCLINGNNGKIYGLFQEGGIDATCSNSTVYGNLYEYDPATNGFNIKKYFNSCISPDFTVLYPQFFMKTSLGHFIITDSVTYNFGQIFKYDPTTNIVTRSSYGDSIVSLIEICRKPAYQEIIVNTFDTCPGGTFTYNVNNTNATTYQWQQNNVNVVGQTTGTLNLTNIAASNAGTYTCTMTNECGTTTTMPLTLTVGCLGTNTTTVSLEKTIKLFPNPTNNLLNIELPTNIDLTVSEVNITNLLGQTIKKTIENTTTIDVSALANGVYLINLKTNLGNWNGKFIKK